MKSLKCKQCGAPLQDTTSRICVCAYCGTEHVNEDVAAQSKQTNYNSTTGNTYNSTSTYTKPTYNADTDAHYDNATQAQTTYTQPQTPVRGGKDKLIAALLALFLGGFGAQYFYLGDMKKGIISLIFYATCIPSIIGFIMGIKLLLMSNESFKEKYC